MSFPANAATFSPRARQTLHRLLHRDLRRCTATALQRMVTAGCAGGSGGGYELTTLGRRCAELSEPFPADVWIEVDASCEPWSARQIQAPLTQRSFPVGMVGRTARPTP
jgi:hypothetical protein